MAKAVTMRRWTMTINPAIAPRPSAVGGTVEQEHSGGRDVAPIGAGVQGPRALPVGLHSVRGVTMAEVLVASVAMSLVAGGTMMAFTTAARLQQVESAVTFAEANGLSQEVLETLRNHVAADDTFLASKAGLGWQDDDPPLPASGGTESFLSGANRRCYRVTADDCNADSVPGDCYLVESQVCWNDLTTCTCPLPNE